MGVFPIQIFDVKRDAGRLRKGLKPFLEKLHIHLAQLLPVKAHLPDQIGPHGNVKHDTGQGFVHGDRCLAIAANATPIAKGKVERLANGDAGIFRCVMAVDVQIAHRLAGQIDQAVARKLFQHVVQKTNAGRHVIDARSIQVDFDLDLGFFRFSLDTCFAHGVRPRSWFATRRSTKIRDIPPAFRHRPPLRSLTLPPDCPHLGGETQGPEALCPDPNREEAIMDNKTPVWHGTTILCVRKNNKTVIAGDGQVSLGDTVVKTSAKKVRRLGDGSVIAGFAGATADALTLFERLETRLEQHPGQLTRAAVEMAKDWRTDRYLRRLEAMMAVADKSVALILTGTGDVLEPEDGLIGIGSGGNYALAAARALFEATDLAAEDIVKKSMAVAAGICVYTNTSLTIETV